MNLVDDVTAIVARVRSYALSPDDETAQIEAAIRTLPGVDGSDQSILRCREHLIEVGLGSRPEREIDNLERIRALGLTIAPEIAALLDTAEGYVVVRRYPACQGEQLVRVATSAVRFSRDASARFRADTKTLLDHGLQHAGVRGFGHWWVAEPSGTIVLDSWAALQPCSSDDRDEQLALIDRRLADRQAP